MANRNQTESVPYDAWFRRNPLHPGEMVRAWLAGVEDRPKLTVAQAAAQLGVSAVALSRVLNGHGGISPNMALKLEAVGWGHADIWMELQSKYDLAQARNRAGQWPTEEDIRKRRQMLDETEGETGPEDAASAAA